MTAHLDATLDSLPPACEAVLNAHVLKLAGEPVQLDDAEAARIQAHRAECAVCRELLQGVEAADGAIRAAFTAARPSAGFAARTLAALPAHTELRVFGAPRKQVWRRAGIAAGIALAAGLGLVFVLTGAQPALAIQRGALVDDHGRALKVIPENTVCTAQEDTLIRGKDAELLNIRKGARFKIVSSTAKGRPVLGLASGDVYAAAAALPVRMDCPHFAAQLNSGDCFLTHEAAALPQSVMILFTGDASVSPHARGAVALHSGQVFVCVGSADDSFSETLELSRATALAELPAQAAPSDRALRRKYEQMVDDYRAELTALDRRIAADGASPELRDRSTRIAQYLEAHEARLKTMRAGERPERVPAEAIETIQRGIKSHSDPATWM